MCYVLVTYLFPWMQMARSFVMKPFSTVLMTAASKSLVNWANGWFLSNLARCCISHRPHERVSRYRFGYFPRALG